MKATQEAMAAAAVVAVAEVATFQLLPGFIKITNLYWVRRVYLSDSLFTAAERAFNRDVAAALHSAGYSVFLPQEVDQHGNQKEIFNQNVQELENCDLVLAVVDGSDVDSGTAWEMGYAYAMGKPVVALRTDFRDSSDTAGAGVNLMLYYGATKYVEEGDDPVGVVVGVVVEYLRG